MLKLATFRGVSQEGEPLNRIFRPGDSIKKVAGSMMPEVQQWLSNYQPEPNKIAILVNALGASEYWGQNVNGDIFPESALLHDCRKHPGQAHPYDDFTGKMLPPYGYWTFLSAHPFVHHCNKDPSRAFGKVVLACWNPRMHRVELIIILDKELAMLHGAQHVIDRILAGEYPDCSMGCRVPYDVCTICDHKSKTRKDYCNCIRLFGMNKILDDGRQIGVINTYPRFFDISFVFIGADKSAKVMCKLGSLWVPQSVLDAEELYGEDNEDGIDLVKAASVQVPRNFLYLKEAQTNVTTGAGIGGVDLVADDIAKGPPDPNDAKLMMSKEDKQENEERRAIADGALKTNADVNETDEFPSPLYPYNSGAQTKIGNDEEETKGPAPSTKQVTDFLKKNPNPSDEQFHEWAESNGFNVHKAEAVAYRLASSKSKEAAQISKLEHYGSMKRVWEAAKRIKIGPPPKPNRKEYPFTGTIDFRGLMIHVENKPGSVREGKGWKTNMRLAYGEFQGTRGVDKDKLDVYVGPYRKAPNVFIIHQNFVRGPKKGKYDEDKVMVGFESPDQAKQAYLAHYDSPKYFRSITTMAFPLFKRAIMKKEVHGEKVASELAGELEKVAIDLKLEDLFAGHKTAQRRERTWKKSDGLMTKSIGSGMDDWDQVKTASTKPEIQLVAEDNWQQIMKELGHEEGEKRATPLEPSELLKVSNDPKTSSQLKWADIVKEIGPSKAVGKVSPMLSASEPDLPRDTLNEMGGAGLERGLSTPSMMGMVLKPREFQRVCLSGMGREGLADKLDDAGAVFKPSDQEATPCGPLSPGHVLGSLIQKLIPHLREKSYFGPPVRQRIIRITISKPTPQQPDTEVESPLLSKVAAAYNWYRREQMKLAGEAMEVVTKIPELHAALYGMSPEDLFGKTAAEIPKINPKTLAVVLGAVPLTLMYSAHARGKRRKGEELGMLSNLMADHPWLSTLVASVALKKIMDTPQAQQAVEELFAAGKRIAKGKGTAPPVLV